jgi:hypothetical protein
MIAEILEQLVVLGDPSVEPDAILRRECLDRGSSLFRADHRVAHVIKGTDEQRRCLLPGGQGRSLTSGIDEMESHRDRIHADTQFLDAS